MTFVSILSIYDKLRKITLHKARFLDNLDLKGKRVFDLGCGEAGCWMEALLGCSGLDLFLFEPHPKVLAKANDLVHGTKVEFGSR